MKHNSLAALAILVAASGCYHATVETGATPSTVTVEKGWAASWIYGLVPPSTISTAEKCKTGIARVSTQLTFPNMLVGFLTLGIFTPMEVKVTCATKGTAMSDGGVTPIMAAKADTPEARVAAFIEASRLSAKLAKAVLVEE